MQFKDTTLTGILRSLISDEYLASRQYYFGNIVAQGKQLNFLNKNFEEIGKDELDDHYNKLVTWAQSKNIPIPTDYDVMQNLCNTRYVPVSDPTDTKALLEIAIKGEQEAIEAYTQAMNEDAIKVYPDLVVILGEITVDEREHLRDLEDLKSAMFGSVDIVESIPTESSISNEITNFCKKIEHDFNLKLN